MNHFSEQPDGPVTVVVPTFWEAENIAPLAARIDAALSEAGIEWELIVVDDDSGDGIEAIVEGLGSRLPIRLEVRRERPRDLSLAVLRGISLANYDRVVVMDADLSHPPERIPSLLPALDGDHDMAVGSRYLPGGSIDETWEPGRLLNSRVATALTRPLTRCSDPMSGFFAVAIGMLPGRNSHWWTLPKTRSLRYLCGKHFGQFRPLVLSPLQFALASLEILQYLSAAGVIPARGS